jgi:hypothetical protein
VNNVAKADDDFTLDILFANLSSAYDPEGLENVYNDSA